MAEQAVSRNVAKIIHSLARQNGEQDFCLLDRFVQDRDEKAFEMLIHRHGPMVWRTCQRVARQTSDAEDAFQSTFLVLCRKVGSIGRRESLGGWLHQVAYRIALKASSRRTSRRLDEEQLPAHDADPATGFLQSELRQDLDEALSRLPQKYRVPLVLCCLEGKTRTCAAAELSWAEGTLSSRLAKGKDLLRTQLLRRGVTLPAVALATLLAEECAARALPHSLLRATLKLKSLFMLGEAAVSGGQAVRAVVMAQGALHTMFLTKLKIAALVLLSAGILVAGAGMVTQKVFADKPAEAKEPLLANNEQPPQKADWPLAKPVVAAEQSATRTLRVVVLDPQGKPVPDAKIHAGIWTEETDFKPNRDYVTDVAGAAKVELPKTFTILRLWASKKPFVPLYAGWESNELASGRPCPAEYTFRMEPAVAVGGQILDEQGKPIAGAKVQVQLAKSSSPAHTDGRFGYDIWLATGDAAVTTNAEGRWRIGNVPDQPNQELRLLVSHPDFASDEAWGQAQRAAGITTAMLRQETATLHLKAGAIVRGRVTAPDGRPIKDAIVVVGDDPYFANMPKKFPTDADGRFRLPALPLQETTITVIAPGWAPQLRRVNLQAGLTSQDFRMQAGKPIRLRIVDGTGKPVPRTYVSIIGWKGSKSLHSMHNPNHPKLPDTKIPARARTRKATGNGPRPPR